MLFLVCNCELCRNNQVLEPFKQFSGAFPALHPRHANSDRHLHTKIFAHIFNQIYQIDFILLRSIIIAGVIPALVPYKAGKVVLSRVRWEIRLQVPKNFLDCLYHDGVVRPHPPCRGWGSVIHVQALPTPSNLEQQDLLLHGIADCPSEAELWAHHVLMRVRWTAKPNGKLAILVHNWCWSDFGILEIVGYPHIIAFHPLTLTSQLGELTLSSRICCQPLQCAIQRLARAILPVVEAMSSHVALANHDKDLQRGSENAQR
jgi:hypothetical protein